MMDSKNDTNNALQAAPPGSFSARVYEIVRRVPYGKVVSYGQIACQIGSPRAARQVGCAMRNCPEDIPWQRVVKSNGAIACGGHADIRRAMLISEGVPFTADGRVDMNACLWEIAWKYES